jgi:DNA end-binding protein Ku
LSLGLVVVPVRLYPAIRKKAVRFHEIDRSGRRVRHVRFSEPEVDYGTISRAPQQGLLDRPIHSNDQPVRSELREEPTRTFATQNPELSYEETRKGFEVSPGEYVSLSREEVAALAPERSRVIDVEQFVDVAAVDPIYFESRYYMVPDREWSAPFQVLRRAMSAADRMAIAWFTLRSRRYLCAVRPFDDVMLLTTMVHADEVVKADFWNPSADAEPTAKELKMAQLLIDTLSGPFEPEKYPDEHRQRVMHAIEERTPLAAAVPSPNSPTRVLDLMAALEASVKAAKAARSEPGNEAKPQRRRARGA